MYERGEGVLVNFVDAVRWYESAAAQACCRNGATGRDLSDGTRRPDTATPAALVRLEDASDQNSLLKRLYPRV